MALGLPNSSPFECTTYMRQSRTKSNPSCYVWYYACTMVPNVAQMHMNGLGAVGGLTVLVSRRATVNYRYALVLYSGRS